MDFRPRGRESDARKIGRKPIAAQDAKNLSTLVVSHPACLAHDMGEGHPERPERMRAVERALESEAFQMLARDVAPRAELTAIARVHPKDYIDAIRAATPKEGLTSVDPDTSMSPGTYEAALRAAGGAVFAVDEVMSGKVRNAFVAARPPGHHAEIANPMGSASSTTPPSPRATLKARTGPSGSRSSISTSITATAPSTSSGTIRPSCTPRPIRCRIIPAPARSPNAANTTRSSTPLKRGRRGRSLPRGDGDRDPAAHRRVLA